MTADEIDFGSNLEDEPAWAIWLLVAFVAFGAFVEIVCK